MTRTHISKPLYLFVQKWHKESQNYYNRDYCMSLRALFYVVLYHKHWNAGQREPSLGHLMGRHGGGLSLDHLSVEELKFTNCNVVTFVTLGHGRTSVISMVVT